MKLIRTLVIATAAMWMMKAAASPIVDSVIPANGATDVSVNSPVSFTFDVEMVYSSYMTSPIMGMTASIKWSPAISFTYSMSSDFLTLTCTPKAALPANTLITWTLNPDDATIPFTDFEGTPLPLTTGSFTTADSGGNPNSDEFGKASLIKTLGYRQTNATTVIIFPELAAFYSSSVEGTVNNPVAAASLTFAGSSQPRGLSQLPGKTVFSDFKGYSSQSAMDAELPSGNYVFNVQRQSGSSTASMNIANATDYLPIPKINNFAETQTVNPSNDFTFLWTAIPDVQPGDSIHFYINGPDGSEIFSAPSSSNTLANTATSITIPAGFFEDGKSYEGILCFTRTAYFGTNSTAALVMMATLTRTTYFPITISDGVPATAPKFTGYGFLSNGHFALTISAQPGKTVIVESSPSLGTWMPVFTNTVPAGGTVVFEDAMSVDKSVRFYRSHVQ